jgi:molecular chaperone GrpE
LLQRERASFLNYRRRIEQERTLDRQRAQNEMVLRLLPVLDELERALLQRPADLDTHPWAAGVGLMSRRLTEALHALGVEQFGASGDLFAPEIHDAVTYTRRPDAADHRVEAVLRPGYVLRSGELLRPAQVSVVGPAEHTDPTAAPPTNTAQHTRPTQDSNNATGG